MPNYSAPQRYGPSVRIKAMQDTFGKEMNVSDICNLLEIKRFFGTTSYVCKPLRWIANKH